MKTNNNFILGSGIAGLIAKHYNPSYKIISPDVGGQLTKNKNLLMTFYIHNHPVMRELLEELKIPYKERRLKIFYNYYGKILDAIDNKKKFKFISNKMSEFDYDSNSIDIIDTNLSTEKNYLDILDVDIDLLIKRLTPKDTINGKVKLINNNRKFLVYLDKTGILHKENYDKIISTIPAPDFFNLLYNYKCEYYLNYLPCTFVSSTFKPDFVEKDSLYYVLDDNLIYNRVQPFGGKLVYEITGFPEEEIIKQNIKEVTDIERRYCGIVKSENITDFKNIKFLGRFAQWEHSIHTEEVIIKSKKIAGIEK
jgi:hypothetical protein